MIFVSLGTQDKSFSRLLEMIDKSINNNVIKDKVIVQAGYTKYKSDNMEIYDYVSPTKFKSYIEECDLFITHGGVGNILSALKQGKKIIAVPRLSKYGEHTNDHQLQIVDNFYEKGYILKACDDLDDVYKDISKFKPKKWVSDNSKIIDGIRKYIEEN